MKRPIRNRVDGGLLPYRPQFRSRGPTSLLRSPRGTSGFVQIGTSKATNLEVEFEVASIHLAASHQGVEGWYHLTMLLTGDMPITIGRELWGEAKSGARYARRQPSQR